MNKNKIQSIINDYKQQIFDLSKYTGLNLVARLDYDYRDNSFYQKIQPQDKLNNKYEIIIDDNLTYLISDLHFGKDKNRDKINIEKINRIPINSQLLFLGDICYKKNLDLNYLINTFKKINCKNIFLLLGNHDVLTLDFYYKKLGIKGIYDKIILNNYKYVFSH